MKTDLIELTPLSPGRIEEMRGMRNWWVGRGVLLNDRALSAEEHRIWYEGLDKKINRIYFVISLIDGQALGYVTCFRGGFDPGTAEIGVCIKEDCPWFLVPFQANILLLRHGFEDPGVGRLIACFRPENVKAIRFNFSLGFAEVFRNRREVMTELNRPRYLEWLPKYQALLLRGGLSAQKSSPSTSRTNEPDPGDDFWVPVHQ